MICFVFKGSSYLLYVKVQTNRGDMTSDLPENVYGPVDSLLP